jgi:integrase
MTLKTAVHYAQNWDILSRDIASGLVTPKITKIRYDVLNRDELQSLLQALKQYKHGLMIRLIAVTGMRTEEAVALTWRDVVLKTSTIRITRAADVATRCLNDETKEPASIRTLQLDNETMAMLVEHMDIQFKGTEACLDGLVFPADDGRPLSYNSVRRTLQRALKTAGLRYVSPHKLRHGVASILDDEGCSSAQIAETLGHANPTVTNKIYAHALRHGKSILAD